MRFLLPFARRWVAGAEAETALVRSETSNARGLGAILNNLGEHYRQIADVEAAIREYHDLLDAIKARGLDACISVKPTQLGLSLGEEVCWEALEELIEHCQREEVFLWLDMEGSETTEATVRLYERCLARYGETGLALQANLRRTQRDLRRLLPAGIVRLVKGAYREPRAVAYPRKREVDLHYRGLMGMLFREGRRFALGTHDGTMIQAGLTLQEEYARDLEFQMLLGVRDPLKEELRSLGHRVLEYIPYGPHWLPYFTRRLEERPMNLVTMVRSLVGT